MCIALFRALPEQPEEIVCFFSHSTSRIIVGWRLFSDLAQTDSSWLQMNIPRTIITSIPSLA